MIRKMINNGTDVFHASTMARIIELEGALEENGVFEPQIVIDVYNRGVLMVQHELYGTEESRYPLQEWGATDDVLEVLERVVSLLTKGRRRVS